MSKAIEAGGTMVPETIDEWRELLAKLVHVQIGPPKESHDVGPVRTFALYAPADTQRGVDALVTGVSYDPPRTPVKVGDEWKYEMDVLFPHGRLSLTVDLFLDKLL